MSNRFSNDPFFNEDHYDPFSNDIFGEFDRHMQKMNNFMNHMSNSDFDANPAIDYHTQQQKRRSSTVDEPSEQSKTSKKGPIVEESDDQRQPSNRTRNQTQTPIPQQGYCYSSSMTSYSDGNGVVHTKSRISDNVHGTRFTETRKIGDRSVTWKRDIDKDGQVQDTETRHNIYDEDVEQFSRDWDQRKANQNSIGYNRGQENPRPSHRKALK
jgi:hypothetical protein